MTDGNHADTAPGHNPRASLRRALVDEDIDAFRGIAEGADWGALNNLLVDTIVLRKPAFARATLDAGADPDGRKGRAVKPKLNAPPLSWAACQGEAEIASELLSRGADPNIHDTRGVPPLFQAVFFGNPDTTRVLLDAGADPDHRDAKGWTPREMAQAGVYTKKALEVIRWHDEAKDIEFDDAKGAPAVTGASF